MSRWSTLGTNTWIAYNDIVSAISDGVTNAIGSTPGGVTGEQWLSSAQLQAWVGAISAPATSTQWCTKGTISLLYLYSYTFYIAASYSGHTDCFFHSSALACSGTRSYPITLYATTSTLSVGTQLYYYSGGTLSIAPVGSLGYPSTWAYQGSTPILFNNNGTINSIGACSYTITYQINNNNAASYVQGYIYNNSGSPTYSTSGTPAGGISGTFTLVPGGYFRATDVVTGGTGYSQSITITGGASYSAGPGLNSSYDSGNIYPTGDCTIDIELS